MAHNIALPRDAEKHSIAMVTKVLVLVGIGTQTILKENVQLNQDVLHSDYVNTSTASMLLHSALHMWDEKEPGYKASYPGT